MKHDHQRCHDWPACICGDHWRDHQNREIAPEAFETMRTIIEAMLHCVRAHCPDPRVRTHATIQLMHPVFQRREGTNVISE